MSSIVISGDTSGTITLAAPAVAGTNTITFPASTGTMVTTGSPQPGGVIQVVTSIFSSQVNNSTNTPVAAYSLSITPKFATSKILIFTTVAATIDNGTNTGLGLYLNRNVSSNLLTYPYCLYDSGAGNQRISQITLNYQDSPATTSSTAYSIYFTSSNNSTAAHISQYGSSYMTLMEVAA